MKISIDAGRCQGHGRCYDLAPEVFGEDDEGYGVVLVESTEDSSRARLAAANCPESAITVDEEVGT